MFNDVIDLLERHADLAGWAQFAGAVLALSATVLAAWLPLIAERRRSRALHQRIMRSAARTMSLVPDSLGALIRDCGPRDALVMLVDGGPQVILVQRVLASLESLPIHDFIDDDLARLVEVVRVHLAVILANRERVVRAGGSSAITPLEVRDFQVVLGEITDKSKKFSKRARALGFEVGRA